MQIRGVIFDLDGTLIDSRLDFDAMRRDMGLPHGQPILEGIAGLEHEADRARCCEILHRHELAGATGATLMPGAAQLLEGLSHAGIRQAVLTRNSRSMTDFVLARLGLEFSQVVTREDAPPKPDPAGLHQILAGWTMRPDEALFVGDFHFDLRAGRAAGLRTVLYAPGERPRFADEADHVVTDLVEIANLVL